MNPVTGAVPPLIRGHGIRFEVDAEMDAVILHRIREYRNIGRPFL